MDDLNLHDYIYKYNRNVEIFDTISVKKFDTLNLQTNSIYKDVPLRLSKTSKVIIQGKYRCISCNLVATHAVICRDKGSQVYSVRFFGYAKDTGWNLYTKDHILPKAEDGRDSFKNLQCMCYSCNQEKAADTTDVESMSEKEKHELSKVSVAGSATQYREMSEDFKKTRTRIRKLIKKMPWYLKMLGVHKLLQERLLKPLEEKGYGNNG